MANIGNKNTMLPTYNATYENMVRALNDGTIASPCWVFIEDKNALCFIHFDTVNGVRKLVPHTILWDKIESIEERLEGLVDPDTGETVNVKTYVDESKDVTINYTDQQIEQVKQSIIMITNIDDESEVGE